MKILMICFVYNEIKYLPHLINYYQDNGCDIYVIDNYSDDGTYEWLVENKIPCHRVDTQESFNLNILSEELVSTVNKIKPDWVILAAADLYHIVPSTLSDYIQKVDSEGYNQIALATISAVNIERTNETPLPEHHNYAIELYYLTMICKYGNNFMLCGDSLSIDNPRPYDKSEGVSINYGLCKPPNERERSRLRTQKAWDLGMDSKFSIHYEEDKKHNWEPYHEGAFDLRNTWYYPYILKINGRSFHKE